MFWPISNKYIYKTYKGREIHTCCVQAGHLLFVCYFWRYKYFRCTILCSSRCFFECTLPWLLSCILYYFSLHDDYSPLLYATWSVYITVLPFLINWNGKWRSKSNILTMDHELVFENSSSAAFYKLLNTIIYLKP